ncbi:hypothetical protein ACN28E_31005 [Archangium lansingense]|uniref:hypothetical protein n=1 Tax=Archangium lansingense TaxID=2995310 RepID=UPI003B7C67FA
MMEMDLRLGLVGPDLLALLRALPGRFLPESPPATLSVDFAKKKAGADWLAAWGPRTEESLNAEWEDSARHFLIYDHGIIVKAGGREPRDARGVLGRLSLLPFTVASFDSIHPEWEEGPAPYWPPGFGDLHYPHGWACAFKGPGHARLVSRRWLDFGPWRVLRGPEDTTLVQFHDLEVDAASALAQARPGHERMGISAVGGYVAPDHFFSRELGGLYEAGTRTLRIIVHGREVSQEEMLDACAARMNQALGPERPIERVAYVFMEPEVARAHLHELWLRELECWTIELGNEVRLDDGYLPTPQKPQWVQLLEAREPRADEGS